MANNGTCILFAFLLLLPHLAATHNALVESGRPTSSILVVLVVMVTGVVSNLV